MNENKGLKNACIVSILKCEAEVKTMSHQRKERHSMPKVMGEKRGSIEIQTKRGTKHPLTAQEK